VLQLLAGCDIFANQCIKAVYDIPCEIRASYIKIVENIEIWAK